MATQVGSGISEVWYRNKSFLGFFCVFFSPARFYIPAFLGGATASGGMHYALQEPGHLKGTKITTQFHTRYLYMDMFSYVLNC